MVWFIYIVKITFKSGLNLYPVITAEFEIGYK
jgi:hypothetical protein